MPINRGREARVYPRLHEPIPVSHLPANMFIDRRRVRRLAAQMLLVWLFGLAMGMANACALGDRVHHGVDPASIAASDDGQKHHHGDERGDPSKVNCLDFCEKSSIRAPQLKLVGDGSAELGFPLPVQDALKVSGQYEHSVSRLVVDSPHLPGGPPPRIAFQRLAL